MYVTMIAIVCGYILGSFPSAYVVGRLRKGVDIRKIGSRNMGTMNVLYKIGIADGIMVMLLDGAKGIAAILLAQWLGLSVIVQLCAGLAVVVGHRFPVFLRFHGGIGGATSLAILLFLMPKAILIYLAILLVTLAITRNLTFSYGASLLCFPFVGWLVYGSAILVAFSVMLILFICVNSVSGIRMILKEGWRQGILRASLMDRR